MDVKLGHPICPCPLCFYRKNKINTKPCTECPVTDGYPKFQSINRVQHPDFYCQKCTFKLVDIQYYPCNECSKDDHRPLFNPMPYIEPEKKIREIKENYHFHF